MSPPIPTVDAENVSIPRWLLVLLTVGGLAIGGGVGSGVTLTAAPDLELVQERAVRQAVEEARKDRDRDLSRINSRLDGLEDDLDRINAKLDQILQQSRPTP